MKNEMENKNIIRNPLRGTNEKEHIKFTPEYVRLGVTPILSEEFPSLDLQSIPSVVEEEADSFQPPLPTAPKSMAANGSIDNNEHISYVRSPDIKKSSPGVGDYILMMSGKTIGFGTKAEMLEKSKDLLYKQEKNINDLVLLKRLSLKAGVFIDE